MLDLPKNYSKIANYDHLPRLLAMEKQASEEAAIRDMEQRSAPLLWTVYVVTLVVALSLAVDGVSAHITRIADLAATQEALVQCIKGRAIGIDGAVLRCEVSEYKLVGGGHV